MNKRVISLILAVVTIASLLVGCAAPVAAPSAAPAAGGEAAAPASGEAVSLKFQQWWEPELPKGEFRARTRRPRRSSLPALPQAPCLISWAWMARGSMTL